MNVRKTKVTEMEIAEISDIEKSADEAVTEAEFEECSRYDCETAYDDDSGIYGDFAPTPLQQGYSTWIERKQREKFYGKATATDVNLVEELIYNCLHNGTEPCRQILR